MVVIEKIEAFKLAYFELWFWKDNSLSRDSIKCYLKEPKASKMKVKYIGHRLRNSLAADLDF
ncbi:MAG TPA: hypothetical protein PLC35_04420, partial [Methanosarcina vacuolata]|nr:hypothetical protein [Methanosarcina vacuolata]